MKEKMEDPGVSEDVSEYTNEKGQLVIKVNLFEEISQQKYNGEYVVDRVRFKHRDLVFGFIDSLRDGSNVWEKVVQQIAKQRNTQVKNIVNMINKSEKEGGLTKEEQDMLETATTGLMASNTSIAKMYKDAPKLLLAFIVESPIPLKTIDDYEEIDMSLGKILFERTLRWVTTHAIIKEERKKK